MDDAQGDRSGKDEAEELILRTVAVHADSLLRTARRHSLCIDDAQDAYQRGLEIFMRHAERLDSGRAGAWLHTVVKREAKSIRRSRQKLVGSADVDLDAHECSRLPTPEEQLLSFDMVSRSAEALQRLKPQELRALWLKAQGHSYSDIGAITGWSYTKVNRCLTEGRRSFLERYAGIESGDECARWTPVLSAMVDGEATQAQILELRPHLRNCPGCRTRLKAMQASSEPLSAIFPIPLAVAAAASGEPISNLILRAYEAVAGGLHERAVNGVTKAQAALEATAAGKVAAVAASAAAVAGGGYVAAEAPKRVQHPTHGTSARKAHARQPVSGPDAPRPPTRATAKQEKRAPAAPTGMNPKAEFEPPPHQAKAKPAPEFPPLERAASPDMSESAQTPQPGASARSTKAPEFGGATRLANEFEP